MTRGVHEIRCNVSLIAYCTTTMSLAIVNFAGPILAYRNTPVGAATLKENTKRGHMFVRENLPMAASGRFLSSINKTLTESNYD